MKIGAFLFLAHTARQRRQHRRKAAPEGQFLAFCGRRFKADAARENGTGIAQRDVTPEATRAVVDREIPGLAELMRAEGRRFTPRAVLSRGIAGTRGRTLIVNLPGSPKGAVESFDAVAELAPHIIDLLEGRTEHN